MYDKTGSESLPLSCHTEGSESEFVSSEEGFSQATWSAKSLRQFLLLVTVFFTSAVSGAIGAFLGSRFVNLDSQCATYTTHYCELLLLWRVMQLY